MGALPGTAWDVCPRRVPRRRATRAQHDKCSFRMCMFNLALCFCYFLIFGLGAVVLFGAVGAKMCGRGMGPAHSRCCALRLCTAAFPRVWGRRAEPQLMRSAGLIVLVRAFFAALQPHPRASGAVGGVSQLSCACLPCCPPTASPRQWGRGGGSQQGWDIAAVHSLGCARAYGPGEQLSIRLCVRWPSFSLGQGCTAASFGCPGARKRSGDRGPADAVKRLRARNKMVAGARESALATAGSLTL